MSSEGRRVRPSARQWLPLTGLVALTVAMGVYAAWLQVRMTTLEDRLDQAIRRVTAAETAAADSRRSETAHRSVKDVLAAVDLVRIDLVGQGPAPEATARAFWSRARGMVFAAANLPPLPAGQAYQIWVTPAAGAPMSVGLLEADPAGAGEIYFKTPPDIPPPATVTVSIEKAAGAATPTGAICLVGRRVGAP